MDWIVPLLPEGIFRDFARQAHVQDVFNRPPSPQYPKSFAVPTAQCSLSIDAGECAFYDEQNRELA